MKDADKKLIAGDDWVPYLGGDDPGFPVGSGSSQSLTLVNAKTNAPDKSVLGLPRPAARFTGTECAGRLRAAGR